MRGEDARVNRPEVPDTDDGDAVAAGHEVAEVAGLGDALVIIGLANLVSVLTSISLAAVATNLRVRQGGDYYLISRTLGVEYGGALGIVLFLAQSVSIAFYAIGFGITRDLLESLLWVGGVALLMVLWPTRRRRSRLANGDRRRDGPAHDSQPRG